jgi:16S rRNA (adenine1518-N6/adenine1519-N6)-dimethyltransferase
MATEGRRRALGQHFLKDQAIADLIAETAIEKAIEHQCFHMMEVGPGKGAITLPMIHRLSKSSPVQNLLLVERDQKLGAHWQDYIHRLPSEPVTRLEIEVGDFLEIPEPRWLGKSPLAVVSNLPYSAGTAILNRLAQHVEAIPVMVLMFQAEVAHRLRAEPETKQRGSLSVWIQNRWDVEHLISVPPKSFSPPPEVNSEVVILKRRSQCRVANTEDPASEKLWQALLKVCFAQRRKMLRSVVSLRNALEQSNVDGTKRAEALRWTEWDRLFQTVRNLDLKL